MKRALIVSLVVSAFLGITAACGPSAVNPPSPPFQGGSAGGGGGSTDDSGVQDDAGQTGGDAGQTDSGVTDAGEQPVYAAKKNAPPSPTTNNPNTLQIQRELTNTQPKCTVVTIENPTTWVSDGGLTLPAGWGLRSATIKDKACAAGGGTTAATNVTGVVTFGGAANPFPAAVGIHADVFFTPGGNGFPPADVRFDQDGVAVP